MILTSPFREITAPARFIFKEFSHAATFLLRNITPQNQAPQNRTSESKNGSAPFMSSSSTTAPKLCTILPQFSDVDGLLDRYNLLCAELHSNELETSRLIHKTYLHPQDIATLDQTKNEKIKVDTAKITTERNISALQQRLHAAVSNQTAMDTDTVRGGGHNKKTPSPAQNPSHGIHKPKKLQRTETSKPTSINALLTLGAPATALETSDLSFSLLPVGTKPYHLQDHLLTQGFQHINVSGANNNCGLRALLLCITSHFNGLPESLKHADAKAIAQHFNPKDHKLAEHFEAFLKSGASGAAQILTSHPDAPKPTQRTERQLMQALAALSQGLHNKKMLSQTSTSDIQDTVHHRSHMLGNDALSEVLVALKIPAHVVTFNIAQPVMETVEQAKPSSRPANSPENSANTSQPPKQPSLRDSLPCVYLSGAHYQILVPKPLY